MRNVLNIAAGSFPLVASDFEDQEVGKVVNLDPLPDSGLERNRMFLKLSESAHRKQHVGQKRTSIRSDSLSGRIHLDSIISSSAILKQMAHGR
jgi:hypothetical protein